MLKMFGLSVRASLIKLGLVAIFMFAGCQEEDSPEPLGNKPPEKMVSNTGFYPDEFVAWHIHEGWNHG